jgi:hypothetical protein
LKPRCEFGENKTRCEKEWKGRRGEVEGGDERREGQKKKQEKEIYFLILITPLMTYFSQGFVQVFKSSKDGTLQLVHKAAVCSGKLITSLSFKSVFADDQYP